MEHPNLHLIIAPFYLNFQRASTAARNCVHEKVKSLPSPCAAMRAASKLKLPTLSKFLKTFLLMKKL